MGAFVLVYTVIDALLGCAIAVLLVKRHAWKEFPFFFSYILYSTANAIVRLQLAQMGRATYFYGYWYSEIGEIALAVLSVRESLLRAFTGFDRLQWFGWTVRISMWTGLLYGIWKAIAQPPNATWKVALVVSTELLFQYWIGAFGVLFCVLSFWFRVELRRRESWIIFGFLLESLFVVSGLLLRSFFGTRFLFLSWSIPAVSYIAAKSVWLLGIGRHEHDTVPTKTLGRPGQADMERMSNILERQVRLLKRLISGKGLWRRD